MGKVTGFLEYERLEEGYAPVPERLKHYKEFVLTLDAGQAKVQGFVMKPPNFDASKKYPVVYLIHGGPQGVWVDSWSYRWNPNMFAAPGYAHQYERLKLPGRGDAIEHTFRLTRGEVLAEGPYEMVSKNPAVIEAYVGTGHG